MVYYVGTMPYSSSIVHFGIKGMKWGIRRYENPDGTLTQAGKERYQRNLHKEARRDAQRKSDADAAYGSGAGTRRKLIDKEINEKLKNKDYAKHYERAKKEVDVSKSLKRAESLHRHSGDFERGQRLSERGRNVSNTILKSVGSSAATAATTHLVAQIFGGGDKLASSIIYATGGLTIASTLGSGARDAYQINYYERNKKF